MRKREGGRNQDKLQCQRKNEFFLLSLHAQKDQNHLIEYILFHLIKYSPISNLYYY